jgi:RNA polymerase sigma-70 factor (ECF subfamily)
MNSTTTEPSLWLRDHGDCLYRMALLRVGDPDVACDLVQETFLAALRSRASFSGRSTERTWLVGILKHKILDRRRKYGRGLEVLERDQAERAIDALFDGRGHWSRHPSSWRSDPYLALESSEFWDVLGTCLRGLPRRLAEAFSLLEIEDLDREAVCEDLAITPGNLATRLHRARLLLRDCLERKWFASQSQDAANGHVS